MDYKGYVEELKNKCEAFLKEVELTGNENAYTDSLLEDVFTSVARLKDFYDKSADEVVKDEIKVVHSMDELKEYLENKEWQVSEISFGGGHVGWEIGQASPAGEDFWFSIMHDNNVEEAIVEIKRYAYDFDTEEHVKMWIDGPGAPDIETLVEDAKAIQEMLDEIADGVNFCEVKSIGEMLEDATRRSEELGVDDSSKGDIDIEKE